MLIFCIYAAALLFMGAALAWQSRGSAAFFLNGRGSGAGHVGFSFIASCIGSSSTIGMAGLAWQIGAPAFWWLGSGAVGLAVLGLFLARKVRDSEAWTLPELVEHWLGPQARIFAAVIIVSAWLALLAAQFTAMAKCTESLTGLSPALSLAAGGALLILYSMLGGWAAVIRSDRPQCLLFLCGLAAVAFCLGMSDAAPLRELKIEALNEDFGGGRLAYLLFVVGGSYVAGPTMFGILFSAKDVASARRGCFIGAGGLLGAALLITAVGVLCRGLVPPDSLIAPDDVLVSIMPHIPEWAGMALLTALFSAVLSSADSMLITVSTVLCNDVFRRRSVGLCRVLTLLMGVGGLVLASQGRSILELLLAGYDIYVCGVAVPLVTAMLLGRRLFRPGLAAFAMLFGCAAALASMPAVGILGSAALTAGAMRRA